MCSEIEAALRELLGSTARKPSPSAQFFPDDASWLSTMLAAINKEHQELLGALRDIKDVIDQKEIARAISSSSLVDLEGFIDGAGNGTGGNNGNGGGRGDSARATAEAVARAESGEAGDAARVLSRQAVLSAMGAVWKLGNLRRSLMLMALRWARVMYDRQQDAQQVRSDSNDWVLWRSASVCNLKPLQRSWRAWLVSVGCLLRAGMHCFSVWGGFLRESNGRNPYSL